MAAVLSFIKEMDSENFYYRTSVVSLFGIILFFSTRDFIPDHVVP